MKKFIAILATVATLLCMTVTTFAYTVDGSTLTSPADIVEQYSSTYPYAVIVDEFDNGGGVWLYLSKGDFYNDGSRTQSSALGYRTWKWDPVDEEWVVSGVRDNDIISINPQYSTLIAVSHDVYNGNTLVHYGDEDFFEPPPPLAEVVQGVTEETMQGTLPGLAGTMKVLVPCGVGLMALLVVLKLFGKRSLIFRS